MYAQFLANNHKLKGDRFFYLSVVELGDLIAFILLIVAMFSFGTSWNGLSGGDLTLIRLACAFTSVCITLPKAYKQKVTVNKAILLYSSLIIVGGFVCSCGQAGAALQGLLCLGLFLQPLVFSQKYGVNNLISLLTASLSVCVLVMDIFSLATNGDGFLVAENEYVFSNNYYLGNKFVLSYANMLLLALISYRYSSMVPFITFGIFSVLICFISKCSTGVIGSLLILCYTLWPVRGNNAGSIFTVPFLIVAMALVAVAGTWLMTLPIVQSFTVGLLGETADFSGRLPIYSQILGWVMKAPIFGYGSSLAANNIVVFYNGAADCQEGLFQIIMSNGFLGAALFLYVCFISLKNLRDASSRVRGIHSYLIAMAFASLVEINLGSFFLLGLSILNVVACRGSAVAHGLNDDH